MKQREFNMPLSQSAYDKYLKALKLDGDLPEVKKLRETLAIELLSCVCGEYLNRWDGDFIKIEMSNEFQR